NLCNLLRGGVLALAMSSLVVAGEPVATGKVLVFDHGGVLEGDVRRIGERYRIRIGMGETWVPAAGVLGVVGDKESAFQLLKQYANLNDPKDHVRLARWCQAQGLKPRAVEEAEAALAMRPGDRSLQFFRDEVKAFAAMTPTKAEAQPPMAPPKL